MSQREKEGVCNGCWEQVFCASIAMSNPGKLRHCGTWKCCESEQGWREGENLTPKVLFLKHSSRHLIGRQGLMGMGMMVDTTLLVFGGHRLVCRHAHVPGHRHEHRLGHLVGHCPWASGMDKDLSKQEWKKLSLLSLAWVKTHMGSAMGKVIDKCSDMDLASVMGVRLWRLPSWPLRGAKSNTWYWRLPCWPPAGV